VHGVRSDVGTGDNLPTAAVPVLDEGLGRAVGIYVLAEKPTAQTLFGASAVTPVSTSSPEPGLGLETTLQEVPLK